MINRNDSEAFNLPMRGVKDNDVDALKASPRLHSYSSSSLEKIISHEEVVRSNARARRKWHPKSRGTQASFIAEPSSEISDSDYSVIERVKLDHKKTMLHEGAGSASVIAAFSSSSHEIRRRGSSISHSFEQANNEATVLVPEFGAWDVTDPKSGEDYTAIFRKISEEKQSAYRRIPNKTPALNNRLKNYF